jgi:superfamily II DNA helicase RecQ
MTQVMEKYLYTTECRRQYLVDYFQKGLDVSFPITHDTICCDNCSNMANLISIDVGTEVKYFLELIQSFSGKFGKTMFINVLMGVNSQKIPAHLRSHENYGIGKNHRIDWWKTCVQHIINHQLVTEKANPGGFGSILYIAQEGLTWLNQNQSNPSFLIKENRATSGSLTQSTPSHRINRTNNSSSTTAQSMISHLTPTQLETYNLLKNGHNVKEIMNIRKLSISTIEGHIAAILENSYQVDFQQLEYTDDKYNEIAKIINEQLNGDVSKLAPIKALCPPDVTYFEIKCTVAIYKSKQSLDQ